MIDLVTITDQKAMTTSLIVAEAFEKQHKDVLRAIDRVDCPADFAERNFAPGSYYDAKKQLRPMFSITRDGFTFLAMGFTGKKAAEFKVKFIEAFNAMEQQLLEGRGDRRQIDIKHRRGITNPNGLDIKYTLDLTKVVMQPNETGLRILERLTGIGLDDLAAECRPVYANERQVVEDFIAACCVKEPGNSVGATELYRAFLQWHEGESVSQKAFGRCMQMFFQRKKKQAGYCYVGLRVLEAQ